MEVGTVQTQRFWNSVLESPLDNIVNFCPLCILFEKSSSRQTNQMVNFKTKRPHSYSYELMVIKPRTKQINERTKF